MVIDLSECDFIDSAGLSAILHGAQQVSRPAGRCASRARRATFGTCCGSPQSTSRFRSWERATRPSPRSGSSRASAFANRSSIASAPPRHGHEARRSGACRPARPVANASRSPRPRPPPRRAPRPAGRLRRDGPVLSAKCANPPHASRWADVGSFARSGRERSPRKPSAKRLSKVTDKAYFVRRLRAKAGKVVTPGPVFFGLLSGGFSTVRGAAMSAADR